MGFDGAGDGQFNEPRGVAVGPDGTVFVTDTTNNQVSAFTAAGVFLRRWGTTGSGDGQFNDPRGVAVGADGTVFVTDTTNRQVSAFTSEGVFVRRWGASGSGDGQLSPRRAVPHTVYVADISHRDRAHVRVPAWHLSATVVVYPGWRRQRMCTWPTPEPSSRFTADGTSGDGHPAPRVWPRRPSMPAALHIHPIQPPHHRTSCHGVRSDRVDCPCGGAGRRLCRRHRTTASSTSGRSRFLGRGAGGPAVGRRVAVGSGMDVADTANGSRSPDGTSSPWFSGIPRHPTRVACTVGEVYVADGTTARSPPPVVLGGDGTRGELGARGSAGRRDVATPQHRAVTAPACRHVIRPGPEPGLSGSERRGGQRGTVSWSHQGVVRFPEGSREQISFRAARVSSPRPSAAVTSRSS